MNKRLKVKLTNGIGILFAVVAIFVAIHVYYHSIVVKPLKSDRRAHIESSVQKLFAHCTSDMNIYFDLVGNQLFIGPQNIFSSEESAQNFCKKLVDSLDNIVGAMIEVRPGTIPGHKGKYAPSYVKGEFRDESLLPLDERMYPGRDLENSVWKTGMRTYIEGPVYSPACGCKILMMSLVRFDTDGMFAIISIAIDLDAEKKVLTSQNPYPDGELFVINEHDRFLINAELDKDTSATEWIKEEYGEDALDILKQTMADGQSHCTGIELYSNFFYSSHDADSECYYFYAVPCLSILKDIFDIYNRIMLAAIIAALSIVIICIINIISVSKIMARESAMARDLETASKIQQSMLTSPSAFNNGFDIDTRLIPAKQVGGDLYCYLRNEEKLFFCVGDVAGKGIPAAIHMSKCISLFRNISRNGGTSASITGQLNREMCRDNGECVFVTAFIAVLNMETGILDYCNAGHEKPLYWSGKDGLKPRYIDIVSDNIALGVVEDFDFKSGEFQMDAGSVLTQFTDGVDEATNMEDELFGKQRLLDAFSKGCDKSVGKMNDIIIESIAGFVGKHEQSDDITLFTIKYEGKK